MSEELIPYVAGVTSFFATFLSAFAGGGASIILLAVLIMILPETALLGLLTYAKVQSSFLVMIAGRMHFKRNKVNYWLLAVMTFAGILGVAIATYMVGYLWENADIFIRIIPFVLFGVGILLVANPAEGLNNENAKKIGKKELIWTGLFIFMVNIVNGFSGGLGVLVGAYLVLYLRVSFIRAAAYTMISGILINVLQSIFLLFVTEYDLWMLFLIIIGAILGAFFGTKLQYYEGNRWVKAVAIILMFGVGIRMLF